MTNFNSNAMSMPLETVPSNLNQEQETSSQNNQMSEFAPNTGPFSKQMQIFLEMWY